MLAAEYRWGPWQFCAGWKWFEQANPSDDYPDGFKTVAGYNVPGNILWLGAEYAVNDRLELIGALYYIGQNDYLQAPAVCTGRNPYQQQRRTTRFRRRSRP